MNLYWINHYIEPFYTSFKDLWQSQRKMWVVLSGWPQGVHTRYRTTRPWPGTEWPRPGSPRSSWLTRTGTCSTWAGTLSEMILMLAQVGFIFCQIIKQVLNKPIYPTFNKICIYYLKTFRLLLNLWIYLFRGYNERNI